MSLAVMKWVLILSSFIFYGWNVPWFVLVLLLSTLATFCAVRWMKVFETDSIAHRSAFYFGLVASLGNLIFWKYTEPLFSGFQSAGLNGIDVFDVVLPLGISFYTFQQLTYVMDGRSRQLPSASLSDYLLYVTFFPQLVIGPIVRHDELLPQIAHKRFGRFRLQNLIIGSLIFAVGLGKKIIFADNLALLVDPVFFDASQGFAIGILDAWVASISYSLQLYFDFSGYSDMAVGIARMFGLRLPENFYSPLKATSILDFWRRWHITLTRMTTSYVFNPVSIYFTRLAMSRDIPKTLNVILSVAPASFFTFVLIGLWHGASWTFLLFGVLHSTMAIIEYLYFPRMSYIKNNDLQNGIKYLTARVVTLFLIVISLSLFRSPSVSSFTYLLSVMFGFSKEQVSSVFGITLLNVLIFVVALLASQFLPNTSELFRRYRSVIDTYTGYKKLAKWWNGQITWGFVFYAGIIASLSLIYMLKGSAEFLYADF